MKLSPAQLDRACGAVLGTAVGDALGAPYEFGLATVGPEGPRMIGGGLGGFAPGEWTDDTTMAWAILDVAATGADLRTEEALTQIARNFRDWYDSRPPDIGNQTRTILGRRRRRPDRRGDDRDVVRPARPHRSHRRQRLADAHGAGRAALPRRPGSRWSRRARKVGALTHYDPHAQEACVLWSLAIRHAILHAELDVRAGLAYLDDEAATTGASGSTRPRAPSPVASGPTAGRSPRSRRRGPRSSTRPCPTTARRAATSSTASPPPSGSATTPTPSPRSPARCSGRGGEPRPSRREWRRISTATPASAASGWSSSPTWPPTRGRASTTGRSSTTSTTRSTAPPRPWSRHPYDDGVLARRRLRARRSAGRGHGRRQPLPGRQRSGPDRTSSTSASGSSTTPTRPSTPTSTSCWPTPPAPSRRCATRATVVLLHCVAAQSRTPTVGIAYAMLRGVDRAEALDRGLRRAAGRAVRTPASELP